MIEPIPNDTPKILGFKLTGKLHDDDYQTFIPIVEKALTEAEGKVSLLAKFEDFDGWDFNAAWDDLKFGVQHYSDFDRIALVGDKKWEEWMARFCKPFTRATVKYFDMSDEEAAWTWLQEGT